MTGNHDFLIPANGESGKPARTGIRRRRTPDKRQPGDSPGAGRSFPGALLACALIFSGLSSPAMSQAPARGQTLYENQCRMCHESWAHERKGRSVVSSGQDLRKRVAAWATHSGLDWSGEEVDDVTDYLNRSFYHFPAGQ